MLSRGSTEDTTMVITELQPGTRIELITMPNDPDPIPSGSRGTVIEVQPLWDGEAQVHVNWDSGRTLSLIHPHDTFRLITDESAPTNRPE